MNIIEYTLSHVAEEASELTKACVKAQRFGLDSHWESEGCTVREALTEEANDLLGMIHVMNQLGIINVDIQGWTPSPEKMGKRQMMLRISEERGCLQR